MDILDYGTELSKFGISLHRRVVGVLIGQIINAFEDGDIRTDDGLHSIYDFIGFILRKKNPRQVFSDLKDSDRCVREMDTTIKFDRRDGRKGKEDSPVTDMVGLLYLAYMISSDFSQNLRSSSAAYFVAEYKDNSALQQQSIKLESIVEDSGVAYPRTLIEIFEISGITSRPYIRRAVERDFEVGVDYLIVDSEMILTEDAFNWLIVSFRSQRGTDISRLPETISLKRRCFKLRVKRKNARLGSGAITVKQRCSNVSLNSLANLCPQQPKYGDGIVTKPIRVPVDMVEKIKAFIAEQLTVE